MTWAVIITHWLTVDPADLDGSISTQEGSIDGKPRERMVADLVAQSRSGNRSTSCEGHNSFASDSPAAVTSNGKQLTVIMSHDLNDQDQNTPGDGVRKSTSISQMSYKRSGLDGASDKWALIDSDARKDMEGR